MTQFTLLLLGKYMRASEKLMWELYDLGDCRTILMSKFLEPVDGSMLE